MTLFLSLLGLVLIAAVGLACCQEYRDFRHQEGYTSLWTDDRRHKVLPARIELDSAKADKTAAAEKSVGPRSRRKSARTATI